MNLESRERELSTEEVQALILEYGRKEGKVDPNDYDSVLACSCELQMQTGMTLSFAYIRSMIPLEHAKKQTKT